MSRSQEADVAQLYHLHSSNVRERIPELSVALDQRPFRFRTYAGSQRIELPGRDFDLQPSLGTALNHRRSVRDFDIRPLALSAVGRLLFATYGLRGYREIDGEMSCDRMLPSAGGLYPLELYVAVQEIDDLAAGIYHYDARAHQLELRRLGIYHPALADMTLGQDMIRHANIVIIMTAIFARTMWKYGQRGYRYVLLEAGHAGQSVYLAATALNLGPVAIGGFFDEEVGQLLDLPDDEKVVYLMCVGQIAQKAPRSV